MLSQILTGNDISRNLINFSLVKVPLIHVLPSSCRRVSTYRDLDDNTSKSKTSHTSSETLPKMAKKVLFLLLFICCPSYSFLPKTTRTRYGDVSEILNQGHQTWSRVQPRTGYSTELAEKGWNGKWEGDDRRFLTRLRRRIKSRSNLSGSGIKNYLLYLNLFFYLYQTITTVDFIRQGHALSLIHI